MAHCSGFLSTICNNLDTKRYKEKHKTMNPDNTMLEVRCWECQQALVRFHNVFQLIEEWQQITAMLPIPLPPGCYGCMFQHLGIVLTQETPIEHKGKDYEGFKVNDINFLKE